MAENRLARDLDSTVEARPARELSTRDNAKRPQTWRPPETLPQPKPIPGWTHRYIRTSMVGDSDPSNVSAKFREGWEPVRAVDPHYADLMLFADPASRFKDNIEIGGLLLCKAPEELMEQRAAYYRNQTAQQTQAVDNSFMKDSDPRMPLFSERKSTVSFGSGK